MTAFSVSAGAASLGAHRPALEGQRSDRAPSIGRVIWKYLESLGAIRAASELERHARGFDGVDPERARVLRDAARHCASIR